MKISALIFLVFSIISIEALSLNETVKYSWNTAVDVAAHGAIFLAFPFSQTRYDPVEIISTGDQNKDIPIILVHGFMHNSSGMMLHRKRLNKAGFKNVFTVDMGVIPFTKSIEDFAEVLKERINQLGIKEVRLIGHSMGGVVSAHYALRMAEKEGVKIVDVITLGSPLRGTKVAIIGIGKCARQMEYESSFICKLSEEIANSKIRFHHFASKTDLIMRPYHTSFNGHQGDDSRNHLVDNGHVSYLFSKTVSDKMCGLLSVPEQATIRGNDECQ